ncbi:MAG: branched-chain amino acid ABC transporter permease [Chloroflexi bacterium]|nr:branched-chain amino acid ABC transporter permease [Chloroflexota bacterium]
MLDWLDAFLITGLFEVVMIAGLGLLLHLQLGLARIANFGVVGFWGVGMYTFGVLYVKVDWPFGDPWQFLACAAAATLVAGLAGALVGWLISDLDIDGVLVVTLGFATAVQIVATTEADWTGGAFGLGGLGFPYDIGTVKENEFVWLMITGLLVAAILFYVWRVHRSPYGRLLIATGGNEPLARSLGKPTFRTKLWLFVVTSAAMGLLGAMEAVMVRYLDVGHIGISITLAAIVGLVLGGTARVWGAVVGTVLTVGLFDIVIRTYLPLPREWYSQALPVMREVLFGLALILVLLFRPLGLLGDMRRDQLMRKLHGR